MTILHASGLQPSCSSSFKNSSSLSPNYSQMKKERIQHPRSLRLTLSRERKIADMVAGLGLTIGHLETLDSLVKQGKKTEAMERLLEMCQCDRYAIAGPAKPT